MDRELDVGLSALMATYGAEAVGDALFRLRSTEGTDCMTIICNAGLHPLPAYLRRGEIFEVTRGNLNFDSEDALRAQIHQALEALITVVRERRPPKIYLIPWGPAAISCLIKHAIYRAIGIETVDVLFMGNGRYIDIESPMRSFVKPAS